MEREDLLRHVRSFPDKPGVYLMHDENDKIIYVGKAKSLKKRVSSYFRHANGFASPRLRKLVETVREIATIRTETEMEALLLENKLIKYYQPYFNVDLKMNERYAYIKVTHEKFPRLLVTRRKEDDEAVYIGPYVRVAEVRWMLRLIERYLPLRSCSSDISRRDNTRPCMRYALGRCLAPCCAKCSEDEYKERVADVILLLQGNGAELVERLRKRMNAAASRLAFEEAGRLRDTIRAIWRVTRQRNTLPEAPGTGSGESLWKTLSAVQEFFKLPLLPWRIDGFDISHTSGNQTVGVAVVFEQGYPNTSLYRRFNIKTVEGIDDFRSMYETVTRRYKRCLEGQEPLPQLILIDGGTVQLEFAQKAIHDLGIDIPMLSLAERFEEIYLPGEKTPVRLEFTDPVLRLLQSVRDEAHRYAITSHRHKRERIFSRSSLEDIPGIGKAKASQLITKFGSAKALRAADEKDIAATQGIGPVLAKRIKEAL